MENALHSQLWDGLFNRHRTCSIHCLSLKLCLFCETSLRKIYFLICPHTFSKQYRPMVCISRNNKKGLAWGKKCVTRLTQRRLRHHAAPCHTLSEMLSWQFSQILAFSFQKNVGVSRWNRDRRLWVRRGHGDVLLPVSVRRQVRHY